MLEQCPIPVASRRGAHWATGGHNKASESKGLAWVRRDTNLKLNLEVQSHALARVAHIRGGAGRRTTRTAS